MPKSVSVISIFIGLPLGAIKAHVAAALGETVDHVHGQFPTDAKPVAL